MEPNESMPANQLDGTVPSGVARLTHWSTQRMPMLQTIG